MIRILLRAAGFHHFHHIGDDVSKHYAHHPAYVIVQAANTARVLGTILIVFGMLTFACISAGVGNRARSDAMTIVVLATAGIYIVPGILFWIFGEPLRKHKEWAAIVLIVLGSIAALGAVISLVGSLIQVAAASDQLSNARSEVATGFCVGFIFSISVTVLVLVLAIKLIMQSSKSIKAIRYVANAGRPLGFQPVMPGAGPYSPGADYPPPGAYSPPGADPPPGVYPPAPTDPPPSQGA